MTGPLAGLRIAVTRSRTQAGRLSSLFAAAGAEPVGLAVLELHDPPSWGPFDAAVTDWVGRRDLFDGLVLTSVNALERAVARTRSLGADLAALASPALVAVVGSATADAARAHGLTPGVIPARASSEGLLEALDGESHRPSRWFIPRALDTREVLETALRRAGADVRVAPVYRNAPPSDATAIRAELASGIDVLTFCSGSAVLHLRAVLGDGWPGDLEGVPVASIGPITTTACRDAGLEVPIEARSARLQSLVDAVVAWAAAR